MQGVLSKTKARSGFVYEVRSDDRVLHLFSKFSQLFSCFNTGDFFSLKAAQNGINKVPGNFLGILYKFIYRTALFFYNSIWIRALRYFSDFWI